MEKIAHFNKVYDLLVKHCGASERGREDFVWHHARSSEGCEEYRFIGLLGFGGKYRSKRNSVDCYSEDETPERLKMIDSVNEVLKTLQAFA